MQPVKIITFVHTQVRLEIRESRSDFHRASFHVEFRKAWPTGHRKLQGRAPQEWPVYPPYHTAQHLHTTTLLNHDHLRLRQGLKRCGFLLCGMYDDFARHQTDLHRALPIWVDSRVSSFDVFCLCLDGVHLPRSLSRYAILV